MKNELADFKKYLMDEKRVSVHTVRNYLSDLEQFQSFLKTLFPSGADWAPWTR